MENGGIPNNRISASSEWNYKYAVSQGRLNFQETAIKGGSWATRANDYNQWLQIDLDKPGEIVTRVATQGRNWNVHSGWRSHGQWVTKYTLQYSNDCVSFHDYKEG